MYEPSPLDRGTIAAWEAGRAEREASKPLVRDAVEVALIDAAFAHDGGDVACLLSRCTGGLGVQAIVADGGTWITCTLNGQTETFPVPADKLLDAFDHPFAYGANLPLL